MERIIQNLLSEYPIFHLTRGKKVLEIRPSIKWNKGDALVYLLETLGFPNSNDVVPFYIGDDKTDEDAFKVQIKINGILKFDFCKNGILKLHYIFRC